MTDIFKGIGIKALLVCVTILGSVHAVDGDIIKSILAQSKKPPVHVGIIKAILAQSKKPRKDTPCVVFSDDESCAFDGSAAVVRNFYYILSTSSGNKKSSPPTLIEKTSDCPYYEQVRRRV